MTRRTKTGTPRPAAGCSGRRADVGAAAHMARKARGRRTGWFNRKTPPEHVGVYECAVRLFSAQRCLILWDLPWDGRG